jgi:ribokinase
VNSRIVALGSINVDVQLRADRWPEPDETLLGRNFLMIGGGKAANVAWLARYLGVESQVLGHVGADSIRDVALGFLRDIGVDLSRVQTLANESTGVSVILVQPNGRKGILLASNANDIWSRDDTEMVEESLKAAPAGSILTTNLEIPVVIVKHAIRCANTCGIPVVLDPSPADRLDQELLESGCFLTPNQTEAQRLTDTAIENPDQALEAADYLMTCGSQGVCVKLGKGGCAVASANEHQFISAPAVQSIDTTGAGDAFAGALSIALLEKRSLLDAARFAVAAAAYAVTGYGSYSSYPSRSQIENFMKESTKNEPSNR